MLNQLHVVLNQLQKVFLPDSQLINNINKLLINNGQIAGELVAKSLRSLEAIVDNIAVFIIDANKPSGATKPLNELTSGIVIELEGLTSSLP